MWIERTVFRSKTTGVLLALAVSAVTAALIAAWWWSRDGHEAAPPVPPPVEASKALPADPGASAATAPPPSIDPADLDALARAASADPLYRRVVARGDLLRRAAVVLENLAQGDSPRLALELLAPRGRFEVALVRGRTVIADASYARYDALAAAVASIDARTAAAFFRRAHAPLEAAYRALGYPGASLDEVAGRALRAIADARAVEGPVEVVRDGGVWRFADPRLEDLGDVDKQLLRLGARNAAAVQAKAREVLRALDLSAEGPVAGERR
jgi:hypothetical protein